MEGIETEVLDAATGPKEVGFRVAPSVAETAVEGLENFGGTLARATFLYKKTGSRATSGPRANTLATPDMVRIEHTVSIKHTVSVEHPVSEF